jgi:hypothetical protein
MKIQIKITQSSEWAKTQFGEIIAVEEIDSSNILRYGKMKRYCRSGYLLVAQLKDCRYGMIPVSKQDKQTQKELNKIKSTIKRPSYPTAFDSVAWAN